MPILKHFVQKILFRGTNSSQHNFGCQISSEVVMQDCKTFYNKNMLLTYLKNQQLNESNYSELSWIKHNHSFLAT